MPATPSPTQPAATPSVQAAEHKAAPTHAAASLDYEVAQSLKAGLSALQAQVQALGNKKLKLSIQPVTQQAAGQPLDEDDEEEEEEEEEEDSLE